MTEVWDYTPEDLDLALNAAGTGYINTEMKDFELIELFDKPALFTNERLTKEDIPKGLYCYDLRTSDDGERFATIEPNVTVNHGGSTDGLVDIELGFGIGNGSLRLAVDLVALVVDGFFRVVEEVFDFVEHGFLPFRF